MDSRRSALLSFVILLGALSSVRAEERLRPGWYRFTFASGPAMTVEVLRESGDEIDCRYQGQLVRILRSRLKTIAAATQSPALDEKADARCRAAVELLAENAANDILSATRTLGEHFPACRPIVHDALRHPQRNVRLFAARFLGDRGDADFDAEPVSRLLFESDRGVRLAAILSLRELGPATTPLMLFHLRLEKDENLRKAIVKTFQRWRDPRLLEPLVAHMEIETDAGVRGFTSDALTQIVGKRVAGDDPARWRAYADSLKGGSETDRLLKLMEAAR